MKALASMPFQPTLRSNLVSVRKAEPVLVPASSIYMRPVEIRRYLRELRKNRQYYATKDFVY